LQVQSLLHASQSGDDAGVFAVAIEGETDADIKKALQALALATTGSLSVDRVDEVQLAEVRERLEFGIAVGGVAGASYQPNRKDWWLPAPIALPIGVTYQSDKLYTAAGIFDVGQYLTTDPRGVRTPNALDAFTLSASIGLRLGHGRAPFVVALTGGAARFLVSDGTGFAGVTLGTFLPVTSFAEN
jgi:hypothetical protein